MNSLALRDDVEGEPVTEGDTVAATEGEAVTVGVDVAAAAAEGVAVGVLDVVQPAMDKEATTSERTIIAVIGFNCIRLCKRRRLA